MQDFIDAVAEVDAGYITDDMVSVTCVHHTTQQAVSAYTSAPPCWPSSLSVPPRHHLELPLPTTALPFCKQHTTAPQPGGASPSPHPHTHVISPPHTHTQVRDKRGMQAAIMRRLEVEEWDKERMRHFYYGLYGMGPWYWDMEERLHNPFFIGARGWNGPPESWIGENQVCGGCIGLQGLRSVALSALGRREGGGTCAGVLKQSEGRSRSNESWSGSHVCVRRDGGAAGLSITVHTW